MASPKDMLLAVRLLGPRWVASRLAYSARRRLGRLRAATPPADWGELPAPELRLLSAEIGKVRTGLADGIRRGVFPLFSCAQTQPALPPAWHRNQISGEEASVGRHWSELGDFAFGDIKAVWELSRFGWAFTLVRDGGADAPELFWRLFADWLECNPPNLGPNWMCGQEASIRLMAVTFAAEHFGVPPERREELARFVVATGRRVRANLGYALAQKNNHGISECVGLICAALLVPSHAESPGWKQDGLRALRNQLEELVYPDGSFSQHSLIYHRLMLHQLCWAVLRLDGAGETRPEWLITAGRRATEYLAAITDPATGEAPLYGSNDGASLLDLTDCGFTDMRPAVQLASAIFERKLRYADGPWNEAVGWLVPGASEYRRANDSCVARFHAANGGLAQLWAGADRLTMRCPTRSVHRPHQADFGHVDIWLRGVRVAVDGGSFSYNSARPYVALGSAREHNAVTVDGREPMRKVTRFLQVPWPQGEVGEGEDGGFRYTPRLDFGAQIEWTRVAAPRPGGGFVVQDKLSGTQGHRLRWHWRMADAAWELHVDRLSLDFGTTGARVQWRGLQGADVAVVRADGKSAAGWESRHYGEASPALSLIVAVDATGDVECRWEFFAV